MVEKIKTYIKKCFPKKYLKRCLSTKLKILPVILFFLIILTVVIFSTRKTIIVSVDGKDKALKTFTSTYRRVLSNNHIVVGTKDKASVNLDNWITNGTRLSIKRAVNVQIDVDDKNVNIQSAEDNIEKMLYAEGIEVKDIDKIYPSKDTVLRDGLKVAITRVETKDIREIKTIDYTTVINKDTSMEQGNKKVIQEGQPGEKETVTKVVYENGKEVSRKLISETIKKQPIQKIVAMGTLGVYTPSRGGNIVYMKSLNMRATAYTADYESTGKGPGDPYFGITATGTIAKRNNNSYSSVAVDPRVIPLGTKLYIEGYGYAIAEDTGGAIKGNRIDLFFNSSSEANNWGVKLVNVYVIK